MPKLFTTCGTEFFVDEEDVPKFDGCTSHSGHYIQAYWPGSQYGAKDQRRKYVHLVVADISDHEYLRIEVDHIDGNKLNNSRSNLRRVTKSQQNLNRSAWGQYPQGISYDEKKQLYRARVQINGKRIGLGRYKKLEDAITARKKYDEEHGIMSGGI